MRKAPQLLPPGELEYIIATARPGNECRLIEHIQAMYADRDRLINGLQQARLTISAADGYPNLVIRLARVRKVIDDTLGGW
jgi:hypothetical protein